MVGNLHHNNSWRGEGWWVGAHPSIWNLKARSSSWRSSGENGCGINEEWFQSINLGCWWFSDVRSVTLFPRKVKDVISCSTTLWYTRNGISPSLTRSTCSNSGFSSFPSMLEKTGVFILKNHPLAIVFFLEIIEPSEGRFSNSQPSS